MKEKSKKSKEKIVVNPTLDAAFKLLFGVPGCEEQLIGLITAVLKPKVHIQSITYKNPEIPRDHLGDKVIFLDILVTLDDDSTVNVEMQIAKMEYLNERASYYLARTTHGQLSSGDPYVRLKPSFVIFFLVHDFFKAPLQDHHFRFFMQEEHQRAVLDPLMTLHFIEIPKLINWIHSRKDQALQNDLELWCRFLYNPNDPVVLEAAMRKSDLKKAKERVEFLESDRESIDIIRKREMALQIYERELACVAERAAAEGEAKGRSEGEAKGRAEGEAKARYDTIRRFLTAPATKGMDRTVLAEILQISPEELAVEITKLGLD